MINSNDFYYNFSIVITTYNRKDELRRCLKSIYSQKYPGNIEVIVIDDCSPIPYQDNILEEFNDIRFIVMNENKGPGTARNHGLKIACNNFVVIMDDDDIFVENAFEMFNLEMSKRYIENYPVISFLTSNAKVTKDKYYVVYSFEELIKGKLKGDTCQIINKVLWEEELYEFPNSKIGAESLLWYKIAIKYGYPVINKIAVNILNDANERITNFSTQINNAHLFANYQIEIINKYSRNIIETNNIPFLIKKYTGGIVYSLLAGDKTQAIKLMGRLKNYDKRKSLLLFLLLIVNKNLLKKIFLVYRKNF